MADETTVKTAPEGATSDAPAATPSTGAPQGRREGGGGPRGDRGPRPGGAGRDGGRKFFRRKKVCKFCVEKIDAIDYKDVTRLRKFISERGKILPRRISGNCARHQRIAPFV